MRMTATRAELMRGLDRIALGMAARHFGQLVLLCCTHLVKHCKQKLCWHGACVKRAFKGNRQRPLGAAPTG